MPTRTAARARPALPNDPSWRLAPGLIAAAACFAAAELLVGVTIGGFFALGRAEALIFLALRPYLLVAVAAAAAAARHPLRRRILFYALTLLLAAAAETVLLLGLGAGNPFPEAGRGLVAGVLIAAIADLVVQLARRMLGRWGTATGAVMLLGLLLLPGSLKPYERIVLGPDPAPPAAARPELMLMTALPIIWGEGGAFDPRSRPAESYRMLEREFAVRPLDWLSEETLTGRLLLLAQPRALAPEELVALDAWVRRGGRVLFLTDPSLDWPSKLPLGDMRRPPEIGLLGPLLTHWGIRLEPRTRTVPAVTDRAVPGKVMRLVMISSGRFTSRDCGPRTGGSLINCEIGKGKATLVADADLLRDELWAPFGPARHQRIADNPLIVAEWLDTLVGIKRERAAGAVAWLPAEAPRARAIALGFVPPGLALLVAAGLAWRWRR